MALFLSLLCDLVEEEILKITWGSLGSFGSCWLIISSGKVGIFWFLLTLFVSSIGRVFLCFGTFFLGTNMFCFRWYYMLLYWLSVGVGFYPFVGVAVQAII